MNQTMENQEIIPYEEEEENMETNERSGIGTGLAMVIGGGLTLAAVAGAKKIKELWLKHREKKERSGEPVEPVEYEVVDDSDDTEESK